jgi:hypothetical protein
MKRFLLIALLSLAVPAAAVAQQVCPCVPLSKLWIVEACETWNCAASATVLANGDPYVIAVPTNSDDYKWVVVRRIVAGAAQVPPDAPYVVETFDTLPSASARFAAINTDLQPQMITGADGKFLVISRNASAPQKRRASNH